MYLSDTRVLCAALRASSASYGGRKSCGSSSHQMRQPAEPDSWRALQAWRTLVTAMLQHIKVCPG
jgi:hypothetical protein